MPNKFPFSTSLKLVIDFSRHATVQYGAARYESCAVHGGGKVARLTTYLDSNRGRSDGRLRG